MLRIGRYEVGVILADRFRLDGGAMFGSVPKTLWNRLSPADDANRISLACRLLVVREGSRLALVDCGMGRKWQEKEIGIFAIENLLSAELSERLPGVTDVILTHLHFDHSGGVSKAGSDQTVQLVYPNAHHYVSAENLKHARKPGPRERASYLKENIEPIVSGKYTETKDEQEILPALTVHQVHGHTRGLQWILLRDSEMTIAFPSDLIPTASHIQVPYVMGYDICAETSMREKEDFIRRAIAEDWTVVFEHDPEVCGVKLGWDEKQRPIVTKRVTLPDAIA